jgi:hypothetical protein
LSVKVGKWGFQKTTRTEQIPLTTAVALWQKIYRVFCKNQRGKLAGILYMISTKHGQGRHLGNSLALVLFLG